ncbi:hypothetical protein D6745_04625 [Candidatus Woesearchaeota archaeon]|nr:MAG: hypothetical protein D6745_04625 [Candidatus Woesearchaeota archaeon]
MLELDDIKKLSPKERIEKIKELEKKRKKELEDAKKLINDSIEEIKHEEMLREIEEEITVPKPKPINIDALFGKKEESKEKEAEEREKRLEETIESEQVMHEEEVKAQQGQYSQLIEELYSAHPNLGAIAQPVYEKLQNLREVKEAGGSWTYDDYQVFKAISSNLGSFRVDYKYTDSEKVANMLAASRKIIDELGYQIGGV